MFALSRSGRCRGGDGCGVAQGSFGLRSSCILLCKGGTCRGGRFGFAPDPYPAPCQVPGEGDGGGLAIRLARAGTDGRTCGAQLLCPPPLTDRGEYKGYGLVVFAYVSYDSTFLNQNVSEIKILGSREIGINSPKIVFRE